MAAAERPPPPRHHLGHFAGICSDLFCLRKATFLPFPLPLAFQNVRPGWRAGLFFFLHYGFPQTYLKGEGTGSPSSSAGCARDEAGTGGLTLGCSITPVPAPVGGQHGLN